MSVSIYAILACAEYGHIVTGLSDRTDGTHVFWADYCSRCQADLRPAPSAEPGGRTK